MDFINGQKMTMNFYSNKDFIYDLLLLITEFEIAYYFEFGRVDDQSDGDIWAAINCNDTFAPCADNHELKNKEDLELLRYTLQEVINLGIYRVPFIRSDALDYFIVKQRKCLPQKKVLDEMNKDIVKLMENYIENLNR